MVTHSCFIFAFFFFALFCFVVCVSVISPQSVVYRSAGKAIGMKALFEQRSENGIVVIVQNRLSAAAANFSTCVDETSCVGEKNIGKILFFFLVKKNSFISSTITSVGDSKTDKSINKLGLNSFLARRARMNFMFFCCFFKPQCNTKTWMRAFKFFPLTLVLGFHGGVALFVTIFDKPVEFCTLTLHKNLNQKRWPKESIHHLFN